MWRGLVVLALWGCNPYRKALLNSEIVEVCPGGLPERASLRFEKGGAFDWRYPDTQGMKRWRPGDDEEWRIKKDRLTVSWNGGYSVAVYRLDEMKDARIPGTSTRDSCAGTIRLERTGERTDR